MHGLLAALVLLLVGCAAADNTISSYWVGQWQVTQDVVCQQTSCCCFTGPVTVTSDPTGELYLAGAVSGSACNGPQKQDNIDAPSSLTFDEEFFGLADYNFALANATDLSGLTITALDQSIPNDLCSFSLYRATQQLLYGDFTPQPAVQPPLPFWAFPYLGTWQFDSSACASSDDNCCCLQGAVTIQPDPTAQSFAISANTSSTGCRQDGGKESDDFPWPLDGTAVSSTVNVNGFLPNQDNYVVSLSLDQVTQTYTLTLADQTTPQCSMRAIRAVPTNRTPLRLGRSTSRVGTYITEATAVDAAFDYWVEWTNSYRGGIRVGVQEYRPVTVVEYNDASDVTLIPLIYKQLTNVDNVTALFSPWSSALTAAAEKYTAGLPFIFVGSTTDSLYGKIPNAFGMSPPAAERAISCMATAAAKGAKTVAAVYTVSDAFNTLAASEALATCVSDGMTVVANDPFVAGSNFTDLIAKWRELDPDILISSTTTPDPLNMLIAIREANWWPRQIYFTTASSLDSVRVALIASGNGWMADYLIAPDSWRPDQVGTDPYFGSPAGFAAAFQAATNETAVSTYVSAFAAGYVLTLAIEAAGNLEAASIVAALDALDTTFWYGDFTFGTDGAPNLDYACVQIINGTTSTIAPAAIANTDYVYPAPNNAPPGFYDKHDPPGPSSSSSHSHWIWIGIIIGIAALAVLGVATFFFVRSRWNIYFQSRKDGNPPRPLANRDSDKV